MSDSSPFQTPDRARAIGQILELQEVLFAPAESKLVRLSKIAVTSVAILTILQFYSPLAMKLPEVVNFLIRGALTVGVAYLIGSAWDAFRQLKFFVQQILAPVILIASLAALVGVSVLMNPARGKAVSSVANQLAAGKIDLVRVPSEGFEVSGENFMFALNDDKTYRRFTLDEARLYCPSLNSVSAVGAALSAGADQNSWRVPESREDLLSMKPFPDVPASLQVWTAHGLSYQLDGGPWDRLLVSSSGGPRQMAQVICMRGPIAKPAVPGE